MKNTAALRLRAYLAGTANTASLNGGDPVRTLDAAVKAAIDEKHEAMLRLRGILVQGHVDANILGAIDAEIDAEMGIVRDEAPRCESGWTGDRCQFPLFHEGPHSNESAGDR